MTVIIVGIIIIHVYRRAIDTMKVKSNKSVA